MDWKTRIVDECVKGVRIPGLFALLPAAFFVGRRYFDLGHDLDLTPPHIVGMALWAFFFTGLAVVNATVKFAPGAKRGLSEWNLDRRSKRPLSQEEEDLLRLLLANDGGMSFDSVRCSLPMSQRNACLRVATQLEEIGLVTQQRLYLSVTLTERGMARAQTLETE